jgi:hypothetical protein
MLAAHRDDSVDFTVHNNRELREHWKSHAQDMGAPGHDTSFGWGIPDADGIVRAKAPDEPDKPDEPGGGLTLGSLRIEPHTHGDKNGLFIYQP